MSVQKNNPENEVQKEGGVHDSPMVPIPNGMSISIPPRVVVDSLGVGFCPCAHTGAFVPKCCSKSQTRVGAFVVSMHDSNQKEPILYKTKSIEIEGVDIRVYSNGNQIEYDGSFIRICAAGEGEYTLTIKGRRLSVKDVCTSDVAEVQIAAKEKIEIGLHEKKNRENNGLEFRAKEENRPHSQWGLGVIFLLCLCSWAGLTWLPFGRFGNICGTYFNVLSGASRTNEVVSVGCMGTPSAVTNALSMQTCYSNTPNQNLPTNIVNATATSVSTTVGTPTASGGVGGRGTSGVTFYLVISCILYIVSYGAIVYMTFVAFRALRRSRKLNGNMRSIIEALRNEPDKERRRAMQKKILDDMIDTYLDRPSADE